MDIIIEKRIGNNLRMIRESQNLTQEQIAARLQTRGCDITRSALAKIEVGQRHIYADELIALKNALNTDYDTILDTHPDNKESEKP